MQKLNKLEILNPARDEILEIARLHTELVGPSSAGEITASIKNALGLLPAQPHMGMACREKHLARECYRMLICGTYLCFYRLVGDTVFVYHIIDGRTNYSEILADLRQ